MYSKEEASKLRHEFWTKFGGMMVHRRSSEGLRVNWVNYKTGIRHLFFRTQVDNSRAYIGIEIHHPDDDIRELFWEQLLELKTYLHGLLGEEWTWDDLHFNDLGRPIGRVFATLDGVSVFRQETWPEIMQFFTPRLVAMDEFWSDARYTFLPLNE
ncbi:MAG: DUF4268 domain-containing protein [Bacteroidota bacterium]